MTDISRRTFLNDSAKEYTHYRSCVKHNIVEGLLVFALDSYAIYDRQGLLPFLFSLNNFKADAYISKLLSLSLEQLSVRFIDQVLLELQPYFCEVARDFLKTYGLNMLDQSSQNLSNILFYFSSHFNQMLMVNFGSFEMRYPNELANQNKALRAQVEQESLFFFYPSLSRRNPYLSYSSNPYGPPTNSIPTNYIPATIENQRACQWCTRKVEEKNCEYCENKCFICENCWSDSKTQTCFQCPVCKTNQSEEKEFIIQQRLCIFIDFKECKVCNNLIKTQDLFLCERGCKICYNCYSRQGRCLLCFPTKIEEEEKKENQNEQTVNITENNKSIGTNSCCDHIHEENRRDCKCMDCWKKVINNGNEGPTHCEKCKKTYDLDFLESLGDYRTKIQCKYCKCDRFHRYIYELGDNTRDYICLDCLRSYDWKRNKKTKIQYIKKNKKFKGNSFLDCCRDYNKGWLTLCESKPAHLNHSSHKTCVICNTNLIS